MSSQRKNFLDIISFPLYLVLSLWVVHFAKLMLNLNLGGYGLIPRNMDGALGILTSPFIHGNLQHLMSNSVPLFVLTSIIIIFYRKVAYQSLLLIYVLTGIFVWVAGRGNVSHIGASGVVYGLVSFVFWTGLFRRNVKSVILALLVTLLYSGYFMGVLPTQKGISWESHLYGALVGIIVAFWYKNVREQDEEKPDPWADEPTDKNYFLPRDTFDKTLRQREVEEMFRRQQQAQEGRGPWTSDAT